MRAQITVVAASFSILSLAFGVPHLHAQAAPPAAPQSGTTMQDATNDLYVSVGKTVLVDTEQPVTRLAIGLGDVAEATAVSPKEIMINGKAAGVTSLIIWDSHGGRQFFNVTVRPDAAVETDNLAALRRELRTELPGQTLTVSMENGNVYLRGTVRDLTSSDRAMKIAGSMGKAVNLLDVQVPASDPQILLKVRFASVDRALEKQLGINLFSTGFGNVLGSATTGQFSAPVVTPGSSAGSPASLLLGQDLNLMAFLPGLNLGTTLEALESKNVLQLLAEPNVIAANGKEASFLAGGQYPYPTVQGTSTGLPTVTIQFKEYGIRLNFIPTITPRNTIRLQVAPEVSSLDYTNQVSISGFEVPGLTTRKMNSEVELADGQSFVIGGLLDNSETETFQKVPFLGDIPILGKFFQSMTRTKNNTELIVIVTPEIVAPIPAGTTVPSLHYPTAFLPPSSNIPMNTPDAKTAANSLAPTPATMPVETLVNSMKQEQPLVVEGGVGFTAGGGTTANTGGAALPAAPPPQ